MRVRFPYGTYAVRDINLINMKMTWETYSTLRNFLEESKKTENLNYINATRYLPKGVSQDIKDNIWEEWRKRLANISEMIKELTFAAGMSQGPNASEEKKEFWGIKDENLLR